MIRSPNVDDKLLALHDEWQSARSFNVMMKKRRRERQSAPQLVDGPKADEIIAPTNKCSYELVVPKPFKFNPDAPAFVPAEDKKARWSPISTLLHEDIANPLMFYPNPQMTYLDTTDTIVLTMEYRNALGPHGLWYCVPVLMFLDANGNVNHMSYGFRNYC